MQCYRRPHACVARVFRHSQMHSHIHTQSTNARTCSSALLHTLAHGTARPAGTRALKTPRSFAAFCAPIYKHCAPGPLRTHWSAERSPQTGTEVPRYESVPRGVYLGSRRYSWHVTVGVLARRCPTAFESARCHTGPDGGAAYSGTQWRHLYRPRTVLPYQIRPVSPSLLSGGFSRCPSRDSAESCAVRRPTGASDAKQKLPLPSSRGRPGAGATAPSFGNNLAALRASQSTIEASF